MIERLLLLLSLELDGVLPLQRVQVGDGLLQVGADPRQLLLAVHGFRREVLPQVMSGHLPKQRRRSWGRRGRRINSK